MTGSNSSWRGDPEKGCGLIVLGLGLFAIGALAAAVLYFVVR